MIYLLYKCSIMCLCLHYVCQQHNNSAKCGYYNFATRIGRRVAVDKPRNVVVGARVVPHHGRHSYENNIQYNGLLGIDAAMDDTFPLKSPRQRLGKIALCHYISHYNHKENWTMSKNGLLFHRLTNFFKNSFR